MKMGYNNNDTPQYIVIKKPTTNSSNSQSLLQTSRKSVPIGSSRKSVPIASRPAISFARHTPVFVKDIRVIKTEQGSSPIQLLSFPEIKTEPSSPKSLSFNLPTNPKRSRLGNLTPDEKLMRRKLNNRTAAQVSRDRRRRYVAEMEKLVKQLKEDNAKVVEINNKLNMDNQDLKKQNEELVQKNLHLYGSLASQIKEGNKQINGINMDFNPASLSAGHINTSFQTNIFNHNVDIIETEEVMKKEVTKVSEENEDKLSIELLDFSVDTLDFSLEDYESDTDSGISMDFDDLATESCDWDKSVIEDLFPDLTDF